MLETAYFDVVVIGGGPAGSTAGTLLAKHGWKVLILEKEKFPRFKIGESMLPGSLRTLERMGVKKKIDAADVVIKRGGRIISGSGDKTNEFLFNDVFRCLQNRPPIRLSARSLNRVKTSVGVVMDSHEFKKLKLDPERAFEQICNSYPPLFERLKNARRVMSIQTTSD
jgi:flavin-dependent dehydrogenase